MKLKIVSTIAVLVLASSAYAKPQDLSEEVSQAITQEAKIGKHELDIQSWKHDITIGGYVSSPSDKQEVERIARNVDGVESLKSNIEIRPSLNQVEGDLQDRRLVSEITDVLRTNAVAADHDIDVIAINGRVKLEGQIGTDNDRAKILKLVRSVNGVETIDDNLSLRPPRPDAEIHAAVRDALLNAEGLDMSHLTFETKNGIVTVHGNVNNHREIDRVLGVILMVKGVRDARSDVKIG